MESAKSEPVVKFLFPQKKTSKALQVVKQRVGGNNWGKNSLQRIPRAGCFCRLEAYEIRWTCLLLMLSSISGVSYAVTHFF